jgi:hypothetical protein
MDRPTLAGRLAVVALLFVAAAAAACDDPGILIDQSTLELGTLAENAPTWQPTPQEPIRVSIEVPSTVRRGADVPVRVTVHNGSQHPIAVGFGQRRGFNVLVARAAGRADSAAVWALPRMFSPGRDVTVTDPLQPGRDTVFAVVWPGVDDAAQLVPPGSYRIRATVSAELVSTKQLWTEWAPITVKP